MASGAQNSVTAPGRAQNSQQELDLGPEDHLILGPHQLDLLIPYSLLSQTPEAPLLS